MYKSPKSSATNISEDKRQERRRFMTLMGVLPAAGFIGLRTQSAWAVHNQVDINIRGKYRYISANGIPDHRTGNFPNRRNPNTIQSQNHLFRVPMHPKEASHITDVGFNSFGVAINGIPFDPAANEFWQRDRHSGWQYEAMSGKIDLGLDKNNAHVQPNGAYHYHGLPTGLIRNWSDNQHSSVIGYAADGFPIYVLYGYKDPTQTQSPIMPLASSYKLKTGTRNGGPGGRHDGSFIQDYEYRRGFGDLDECNGRFCVTPEYPEGTYAYFLTSEYPFIPRKFRGIPDKSFQKRRGSGPRNHHQKNHSRPKPGERPPRP
ncbi:YHYH protein [Kiloniella litopenaei]|uniref:YHYH protein n=1 Tax=Kiloniella litopenaei TaxID=1549748 RepID=UPI0009E50282|nr:YHYH protein [Kiloniella litopenaei]